MTQKIEKPGGADWAAIEAKRDWVRGHFTPESQHKYSDVHEKLRLLQAILDAGWIELGETIKLQCLGITLGDALVQELGMGWSWSRTSRVAILRSVCRVGP